MFTIRQKTRGTGAGRQSTESNEPVREAVREGGRPLRPLSLLAELAFHAKAFTQSDLRLRVGGGREVAGGPVSHFTDAVA